MFAKNFLKKFSRKCFTFTKAFVKICEIANARGSLKKLAIVAINFHCFCKNFPDNRKSYVIFAKMEIFGQFARTLNFVKFHQHSTKKKFRIFEKME
jgi:hypothetical protein